MDERSILAFGSELRFILEQSMMKTSGQISNQVTKSIRPTPLPRVNLPAPKVAM